MLVGEYIIIAQGTSMDERNRLSIHGIANQMHTPNVPVAVNDMTVVTKVRNNGKALVDKKLETKVAFNLKDKEVASAQMDPEVTIEDNRTWGPIIKINQVVFPEYGDYEVALMVNNKKLATTVFSVKDAAELAEP